MNLLIFGGTGRTGRALVEQALEQGHAVTVFARAPASVVPKHHNVRVMKGDIADYDSVESAVKGQDAVLSALGARSHVGLIVVLVIVCQVIARTLALSGSFNLLLRIAAPIVILLIFARKQTILSDGTKNIVTAMEKLGIKRFICESSLGVGDSKGRLGLLYTYVLIPLFLRGLFADKEVQERIIRDSALDWVIVRPAALTNGPRKGRYVDGENAGHWFFTRNISRGDVAEFMLKQLTDKDYLHKTPGVSY
ncbi:MAG TPA: SDR family oxidoreductase [Candidatus Acidoferrales bacterium]